MDGAWLSSSLWKPPLPINYCSNINSDFLLLMSCYEVVSYIQFFTHPLPLWWSVLFCPPLLLDLLPMPHQECYSFLSFVCISGKIDSLLLVRCPVTCTGNSTKCLIIRKENLNTLSILQEGLKNQLISLSWLVNVIITFKHFSELFIWGCQKEKRLL